MVLGCFWCVCLISYVNSDVDAHPWGAFDEQWPSRIIKIHQSMNPAKSWERSHDLFGTAHDAINLAPVCTRFFHILWFHGNIRIRCGWRVMIRIDYICYTIITTKRTLCFYVVQYCLPTSAGNDSVGRGHSSSLFAIPLLTLASGSFYVARNLTFYPCRISGDKSWGTAGGYYQEHGLYELFGWWNYNG